MEDADNFFKKAEESIKKSIALGEKNSNAHIIKKYGRKTIPMITEEMIKHSFLIEKGYLDNNHKPIRCKTCGKNNILEIEVFQKKEVPFIEFMNKGMDAFTGEMEFSIEYRCLECGTLEAITFPDNENEVCVLW